MVVGATQYFPSFRQKTVFLKTIKKNVSLSELGHQGFLALLVVDLACYMFVTVKEDAFGEDL